MQGRIVVTRSLKHEFRFECFDDATHTRLRFIDTRPAMPSTSLVPVDIAVRADDGQYRFSGPGIETSCSPDSLLDESHAIIRNALIDETRDGVLLHSASMRVGGQNIALFGEKGAGKTTLALKALSRGHAVFGDEHVFIDRSRTMTRPRTLRIKERSLALVPTLEKRIRRSPSFTNWDGSEIYSLAPEIDGSGWTLAPYTIDHLIYLQPNHDGSSEIGEMERHQIFQVAMEQTFLPPDRQGEALSHLWKALHQARSWRLAIGDLDQALTLLETLPR